MTSAPTFDSTLPPTTSPIDILCKSWTEAAPFSYEGGFYKFDDFGPGFAPYEAPIPFSIEGQSDEAFAVGGNHGPRYSEYATAPAGALA